MWLRNLRDHHAVARILNGQGRVTSEMALRLERVLGR